MVIGYWFIGYWFIGYCLAFAFAPAFTDIKDNMRANYAKWLISGQTATKEDKMAEKRNEEKKKL